MNSSLRIPIAIAIGYVLGRRKKAKVVLILGPGVLAKRLKINPARLGKEAMSKVGTHPAVGKLGGDVKDQLLAAGKKAAVAAVNSQMNAIADRLHARTDALSSRGGAKGGGPESAAEDEGNGGSAAPRQKAEQASGDEARPRHKRRAAGSPEGERPVSRERVAARKTGSETAGPRGSGDRKPSKAGAGKSGEATAGKPASRPSRATRGSGDG